MNRNVDPQELESLSLQKQLAKTWQELDPRTETATFASIEEALEFTRGITCASGQTMVLVTGSLHLVGGTIAVLEGQLCG